MLHMREPSAPTQPPPVLTPEQLRRHLRDDRADRSWLGVRDYALLLVLADTGCRVGELVGMTVADVDFDAGTIEVIGKGRRRRRVVFGARTGKAVLAYLRASTAPTRGTDRPAVARHAEVRCTSRPSGSRQGPGRGRRREGRVPSLVPAHDGAPVPAPRRPGRRPRIARRVAIPEDAPTVRRICGVRARSSKRTAVSTISATCCERRIEPLHS